MDAQNLSLFQGKLSNATQRNASGQLHDYCIPQQCLRSSQCCYFTIYKTFKKRVCRGSSDSLGIIASIANQSATEYNGMCKRHVALDEQLRAKRLQTINVKSDGNCLFRALLHLLTGSEDSSYANLRASVASYIESTGKVLGGVINITPKDLISKIRDIRTAGMCVGKEAFVVLPDVIKRDVHVHTAFAEPLIYLIASGLINYRSSNTYRVLHRDRNRPRSLQGYYT